MEPRPYVPHNTLVLVGDGQKALFLRNRGSALDVDLIVEQILEQDNPATREQGTDRPGRSTASPAVARRAMEEVDWHHIAKERFANDKLTPIFSIGSSSSPPEDIGPASQSVSRRGRRSHRR